MIPPEIKH